MGHINLLPAAEQHKRRVDALNHYTLVSGIVTVAGAVAMAGMLLVFDQIYKYQLQSLKTEKVSAEAQSVLYLDVEKKALDLEKQLDSLKRAQGQTTSWASVMSELQRITPAGVAIEAIDLKGTGVATAAAGQKSTRTTVSGTADNRRSLGQFQLALASSPYFKNVEIESSNLAGPSPDGGVDYKITLDVNYDKLGAPK